MIARLPQVLLGVLACWGGVVHAAEEAAIRVDEASSTLPPPASIKVLPASKLPAASIGVLKLAEGGYSPDIWRGSETKRIRQLYEGLPLDLPPGMRDVVRRLLLSSTALPADAMTDPTTANAIQQARLGRLLALEAYDGLLELLAIVPEYGRDGYWYEAQFRSLLYTQQFERACGVVDLAVKQLQDGFWRQAGLFCQGVRQDFDGALRTVAAMKESGESPPNWLQALIVAMAGQPLPGAEQMVYPTLGAAELAMLAAGDAASPIKTAGLSSEAARQRQLVATHPRLLWSMRLASAEAALAHGQMDALAMAALVQQVPFTEQELTLRPGENPSHDPMRRAQWFRSRDRVYTVEDTIRAMREVMAHYRTQGIARAGATLYGEEITELSRAIFRKNAVPAFAPEAFSVLFANRNFGDAALWLDTAAIQTKNLPVLSVTPLWRALLNLLEPISEGNEQAKAPASLLLSPTDMPAAPDGFWIRGGLMLEALGVALPADYWSRLPGNHKHRRSALADALEQAAAKGLKGEVLVMALQLFSAPVLQDGDVYAGLKALNYMGFRREALVMAHESLTTMLLAEPVTLEDVKPAAVAEPSPAVAAPEAAPPEATTASPVAAKKIKKTNRPKQTKTPKPDAKRAD